MTHLYLIRHGQTAWNASGMIQGQTDVDLSPVGVRQAEQLARHFADVRLDVILSSPLRRAANTADPLGRLQQREVRLDPRLMERSWGASEGLTRAQAAVRYQESEALLRRSPLDAAVPGGETLRELHNRVRAALQDAAALGGHVAVVSHGGALQAGLHALLGTELGSGLRYHFANASVSLLEIRPQSGVTVHYLNRTSHLA